MKNLILVLFLIPSFFLASENFEYKQGPPPKNPVEVVINYLNLSEEKAELWLSLLYDFRTAQREIINQIQQLEQNLREVLNTENPDPQTVGNLVIQIDGLRKDMRENHEIYIDNFLLLLNEEQIERYIILRKAFELAPLFPAFQETHLI